MEKALQGVWRLRWLLALNLFLVSPVLAYEFRLGEGGPDKTLFFILAASVLWLVAFQLTIRRVVVAHALMFPLYAVVAADLYVVAHYHTRLSSSMLLTIFENLEDGREFFQTHGSSVLFALLLLLGGYAVGMTKIRGLRLHAKRSTALCAWAVLAVLYVAVHQVLGLWMWVATNDRSSPFGIVSQGITATVLYEEALRDAKKSQNFHFHAVRKSPPPEPETYVLVIGESSRSLNWQLYGYPRETNPRLSQTKNLLVFNDVITQAAVTRRSVPLILTRGTIEDEERTARERSVLTAFRETGFQTYWLSTQERDPFTGAINRYPREADVTRFFERRMDGVLVDTLEDLLDADGSKHPKKFIVIHTLGSHFNLTSRYPASFDVFPDQGSSLSGRQLLVNEYDNTIVYTDFVLDGLIEALQKLPGIKALWYVADHGENLRDDARDYYGHYLNNEYDLPIPMLFWYSDELAARFPGKVARASENASRPLNTRVVFHSLIDLAGIDVQDAETPKLSVFSPELTDMRRMVMGDPKPFDFDESPLKRLRPPMHPMHASSMEVEHPPAMVSGGAR
jgi:glucan phosphoethanolaminetransferase (alkaline phosphatase superfamily)